MTLNQTGLGINNVKDLFDILREAGGRAAYAAQEDVIANARALIDAFAEAGSVIAETVRTYGYRISDKQAWAMAFGAIEHGLIQVD